MSLVFHFVWFSVATFTKTKYSLIVWIVVNTLTLPGSVLGWVQAASGLLHGRATTWGCDTSASLQGLHFEMKMAPRAQSHTISAPATCPTCTCSILICFRNVLFGVDVLIVAIYLFCVSHQGCPMVSEYINFFWVMPNEKICLRCELAYIASCVQGAS